MSLENYSYITSEHQSVQDNDIYTEIFTNNTSKDVHSLDTIYNKRYIIR